MKSLSDLSGDLTALVDRIFASILKIDYLYNTDGARTKTNMGLLVIILAVSGFVNSVAAMITDRSWYGIAEVAVVIALGVIFYMLINRTPSSKLVSLYVTVSIWAQFVLAPSGSAVNTFLYLLYPVALCIFLGNALGIRMTILTAFNLMICFWWWRGSLAVTASGEVLTQFVVSFICAGIFAVMVEIVHGRTFERLTFLTRQITDDSYTDALTRLLTRRAFNERFARSIEEQAAQGKPVFVVMCDIDHFKRVNDTYGHHIGDEVLKHVADIISKYAMGRDVCFRWGGEEFLIFLHEQSTIRAVDAVNRIRIVLEFTHFTSATVGTIKVTMSFGLHQYDTTMSMDKNISVADGYLYAAKQNGRNRVEYATQGE
ncbi:MAG: GGDEF domain-containing protein [Oscillospiraceae bacterium]|nr:GGDEF domain-containing protein [Oscillospiraceae bacterium]